MRRRREGEGGDEGVAARMPGARLTDGEEQAQRRIAHRQRHALTAE